MDRSTDFTYICDSFWNTSRNVMKLVDNIITDIPYDMSNDFPLDRMIEECKGNVVMFTNPERKNLPDPDERLYWVKPQRTMNYKKHCGRFVETILVYRKGGAFNELYWQQMTGIYHDLLEEKPIHPHQKPLSMMRRLVQIYTDPGDLVLDPFMGYGTTGMACKLENRHFIGIEIDPFWYRRAVERIDSLE